MFRTTSRPSRARWSGSRRFATTRVASITRLLSGGQPATAPVGFQPSGREGALIGGSSWRHAATAARRRARARQILGARGRPGRHRAGPWAPRDHRHRADRGDFHPDAARGPARQVHTPVRLHGSAPDDHRDGRCGRAPQPILRVPAGREYLLRRRDRLRTLAHRHPSAALWGVLAGLLRFVPYVGPLLAAVAPADAGGGRRSRLVDQRLRCAVVRDHRTAHRLCGRAVALRPLHRAFSRCRSLSRPSSGPGFGARSA